MSVENIFNAWQMHSLEAMVLKASCKLHDAYALGIKPETWLLLCHFTYHFVQCMVFYKLLLWTNITLIRWDFVKIDVTPK